MPDLSPEQRARQQIDAQLVACGWAVQNFREVDFSVGRGVALREVSLKSGPCDYLLLVDRIPVGVVEAKKEGTTLSCVADQSVRYASSVPDFLAAGEGLGWVKAYACPPPSVFPISQTPSGISVPTSRSILSKISETASPVFPLARRRIGPRAVESQRGSHRAQPGLVALRY